MKKAIVILLMAFISVGSIVSGVILPIGSGASLSEIETAIQNGLAYLNSTQASNGQWTGLSNEEAFPVASTAMAILAFENGGHYGWNTTDPYSNTVQKGLDWLFSVGQNVTIDLQPAGNPDTNENGIGVCWTPTENAIYQTPMVLMAIVASQAPKNLTPSGPLGVRTYHDIVVDIVDYLAWAQNEQIGFRGGWSYLPNANISDNSNSNWPIIGLVAANLWGINASSFVKNELKYWVASNQNLSGSAENNTLYGAFGYSGMNIIFGSVTDTASGMIELSYLDVPTTDPRYIAAEGYLNRMWNINDGTWNVNIGSLYTMYTVMKTLRQAIPTPVDNIANYDGTPGVEWFNGTGQYADALIANQNYNGSWFNWENWRENDEFPMDLATAFGVLILESVPVKVTYTLVLIAEEELTHNPIAGANVTIIGPETHSGTTGSNGKIVFSNIQAGTYQVTASAAMHLTLSSQTIQVTNPTNITIALSGYATANFTFSPSQPLANTNVVFNASQSVSAGTITVYQWDFGDNTGGTGINPDHTYAKSGNYTVILAVISTVGNDTYSQVITVTEPEFNILPYIILAILIALLILLLILALLKRYYNIVLIQTKKSS